MKDIYKEFARPFLDRHDSETWHDIARFLLKKSEISPITLKALQLFAYHHHRTSSEKLNIVLSGIKFENPLIVGAGWDKKGEAVLALYTLGAAGVEVGTCTPKPQPGNPKPRQFVFNSDVSLNRLGFNSPGMEAMARNLTNYVRSGIPIGISIGRNKNTDNEHAVDDYAALVNKLLPFATYFAINVSSPNTPDLRLLQEKKQLIDIVHAVKGTMLGHEVPVFIKISPDLTDTELDDIIQVAIDNKLGGIIATNTTINPEIKRKYGVENEAGSISGNDSDFRNIATVMIAHIYRETNGQIQIIGVGGINSVETALEKIMFGATALEIVTAIRGEGPAIFGKINQGILDYMNDHGINNISELVGIYTKLKQKP